MTAPIPTYFALPMASGDAALVAVWPDGNLAINQYIYASIESNLSRWRPLLAPDYATLFPHTAPPEGVADQNERVGRVGLGWHEDGCWQCLCGGEADHKPPIADHCWRCHALRPPRPAREDAR